MIHQPLGNPLGEARDLGNIGGVYFHKGEPAEALKYFEEAVAIFERIGAAREIEVVKRNIKVGKAMLAEKGGLGAGMISGGPSLRSAPTFRASGGDGPIRMSAAPLIFKNKTA
ncbi:MAG: hypothetical protein GTN49_07205 [candidate division Zixibacteria bacterium]|nr:hypothetical protein [candidate division Zixibacteria bacterium]